MNKSIFENNNEEIDLSIIFNFLARNKKLIIFISLISTSYTLISTYIRKPVWFGEFQIILQKNNKFNQESSNMNFQLFNQMIDGRSDLKTQVAILRSPLVLSPVFEKVKEEKLKKKIDISNLEYKNWLASSLDINLKKGTSVLDIKYKDKDKEIILNALNLISTRYQEFSKRDRQREINQGIKYLTEQKKLLADKARESQKILSDFTAKNNLSLKDNFYVERNYEIFGDKVDLSKEQFGKSPDRFVSHFKLLEQYEATLIEKSAILKPSSEVIKNLELKIRNLRESLKRPQAILQKYKTLSSDSARDEYFLNSITSQLQLLELQKAKKEMPWELISKPKVDKFRFSPKRKQETIVSFITSFLVGTILAGILEFKSKKIFSIKDFKKYISFPILSSFYFNQEVLNFNLLNNFVSNQNIVSIQNICLVSLSFDKDRNKDLFKKIFKNNSKLNYVFIEDIENLKKYEKVFLIAEVGKIYKSEMKIINQYLTLISKSIGGVFIIDNSN